VKPERSLALLKERLQELGELAPRCDAAFKEWLQRTEATLRNALPAHHPAIEGMTCVRWTPMAFSTGSPDSLWRSAFESGRGEASAILKAAIYEMEELGGEEAIAAEAFDHELWEHIRGLVQDEDWMKVASEACIFAESKIRDWTGQSEALVGEKLMTAVLNEKDGRFQLGQTPGETQGWHRLGMGLSMAVRNVVTHRRQNRADEKTYAMGVVGTCSLLLTQLRFEHGNRFLGS
jgi:hypothetical protein